MLLFSMLLQSFSKIVIWIEFKMNQEYIAKNLCVQKEVEDNCCQGSCHLKEKMEEDDKNQDTQSGELKIVKEVQLFHEAFESFTLINPLTFINIYSNYQKNNSSSYFSELFHPPNFLS
jgi:hypothetical protein